MQTLTAVPAYTLQAITRQLIDEKGVDITNIVNALAPGRDENVVAVQTALLLNGYKQEASQHLRFKVETSSCTWEPKIAVWQLEYKATAVYDQRVFFDRTLVYIDISHMTRKSASNYDPPTFIKNDYADYDTWENEFFDSAKLVDKYPDIATAIASGFTRIEPSDE